MKKGDKGFMWVRINPDHYHVCQVVVEKVTKRGTIIVSQVMNQGNTPLYYETSSLYVFEHRWQCQDQTPLPHGPGKERVE